MKKEHKKLFDERFKIFLSMLNKKLNKKKKLSDDSKKYYSKVMYDHFEILLKQKDVYRSLFYVFNIPTAIINFNERNQSRAKRYSTKYFKDVIKYFLENDVSEYEACNEIFKKENLKYSDANVFRATFRKWYLDLRNQDSNLEIFEYLNKMRERKLFGKNVTSFMISDKPISEKDPAEKPKKRKKRQ